MIKGISNFGKTIEIKRKRESEFVCFQNGDPRECECERGALHLVLQWSGGNVHIQRDLFFF